MKNFLRVRKIYTTPVGIHEGCAKKLADNHGPGGVAYGPHVRSAGVCQRVCSRLSLAIVPTVPMLHFAHLPLLSHA
jgi:hypothetical protein